MTESAASKSWADIADEELSDKLDNVNDDTTTPIKVKAGHLLNVVEEDIEVTTANPNSPLHSAMTFEELNLLPDLIRGVYAMGFEKPSKIQERALPLALSNPPQNLVAQAQSGTGKTAAFTLSMLSRIDVSKKAPQAICISPVRELSRQIAGNVQQMGQFLAGLEVFIAVPGDNKFEPQQKVNAQVVVGTPGTVLSLLEKKFLSRDNLKILVLDEADSLLQTNMKTQVVRLTKYLPQSIQTLLFSATYQPEILKAAERLAGANNKHYAKITLKVSELSLDSVKQFYIDVGNDSKKYEVLALIFGFINVGGQTIIFVNTVQQGVQLADQLRQDKHTVGLLTGKMQPSERDKIIDDYRTGKTKILISTNVLSRGIDILQIALVVNYDLPESIDRKGEPDYETYLHRSGRSARYGRPGVVINFVHNPATKKLVEMLQDKLKKEILKMEVDDIPELEEVMKKLRK